MNVAYVGYKDDRRLRVSEVSDASQMSHKVLVQVRINLLFGERI
jgi:hypothetical protein